MPRVPPGDHRRARKVDDRDLSVAAERDVCRVAVRAETDAVWGGADLDRRADTEGTRVARRVVRRAARRHDNCRHDNRHHDNRSNPDLPARSSAATLPPSTGQSLSSSACRRAIAASFGSMDVITAAKSTSAQPTERVRCTPTSIRAAAETGVTGRVVLGEGGEEGKGQPAGDPRAGVGESTGAEAFQRPVETGEQEHDRQVAEREPTDGNPHDPKVGGKLTVHCQPRTEPVGGGAPREKRDPPGSRPAQGSRR